MRWLSAEFVFSLIKCVYTVFYDRAIMNLSSAFSNSYHWSTSCWPCYRLRRGPWSRTYWVQSKCFLSLHIQQWLMNLTVLEESRSNCSRWSGALTYRRGSFPCNLWCPCPGRLFIPRNGVGRHVSCDILYIMSPRPFIILMEQSVLPLKPKILVATLLKLSFGFSTAL